MRGFYAICAVSTFRRYDNFPTDTASRPAECAENRSNSCRLISSWVNGAGTSNQYFLYQYEECLWYWFNLTICFSLSTAPKPHYAISMFKPSPENRRMRNPKHERS